MKTTTFFRTNYAPTPHQDGLLEFYSNLTGLVAQFKFRKLTEREPAFWTALSEPAEISILKQKSQKPVGAGCSINQRRAIDKSIGETVERYCGSQFINDQRIFDCWKNLKSTAIPPENFSLFSSNQYNSSNFPFSPFNSDTNICWTEAISLPDEIKIYAPSCYIYVPYERHEGEARIRDSISTGLALSNSLHGALRKGICEVIERDHFSIYWMRRIVPKKVSPASICNEISIDSVKRLQNSGYEIDLLWLELELPIPVLLAIISGGRPGTCPGVFFGLGCDPNPELAALSAIEEGAMTLGNCIELWPHKLETTTDHSTIHTFTQRMKFYGHNAESKEQIQFLISSDDYIPLSSIPKLSDTETNDWISSITNLARRHELNFYYTDLTPPEVASCGYTAIRVICPEACPLDINEKHRHLGSPRLYKNYYKDACGRLLSNKVLSSPNNFNPYPHPFP